MAITDKFNKIKDGVVRPLPTFLTAQKTNGATSMQLDDTTGWEDSTAVHGILYRIDSNGDRIPGSQIDWKGTISGTTVSNLQITAGTDDIYEVGSVVELAATAGWGQDVVDGILVHANQDGTLKNNAATLNTLDRTTPYGLLANTEYFTSTGTWTKPANLKYVIVEVLGGGGGSGGVQGSGSGQAVSGDGGAGGRSIKKILAASLGATETVTVGSGGTAGAAGANAGGTGGTSSFGSHCSATGGSGGGGGSSTTANTVAAGGDGGNGSSGDLNIRGASGDNGRVGGGVGVPVGSGGSSPYGGGGRKATNGGAQGNEALGYGSGGGGGFATTSSLAGRAGSGGLVIVNEYF
jgi:hypothetical protein